MKSKEMNRAQTMNCLKYTLLIIKVQVIRTKKLSEIEGAVNKIRVNSTKNVLSKLKRIVDYMPKDNAFKIQENEKIRDIVERILEFNHKIQSG